MKRRFTDAKPIPATELDRRSRLVRAASAVHPDPGGLMGYLNAHDEALGGSPLDVAAASEAGFDMVMAALRAVPAEPEPA